MRSEPTNTQALARRGVGQRDPTRTEGDVAALLALERLELISEAGRFTGYRYEGREGWFDENGRALRKEFLKSPLKYAHVTSKFGSRRHPVLGYTR